MPQGHHAVSYNTSSQPQEHHLSERYNAFPRNSSERCAFYHRTLVLVLRRTKHSSSRHGQCRHVVRVDLQNEDVFSERRAVHEKRAFQSKNLSEHRAHPGTGNECPRKSPTHVFFPAARSALGVAIMSPPGLGVALSVWVYARWFMITRDTACRRQEKEPHTKTTRTKWRHTSVQQYRGSIILE